MIQKLVIFVTLASLLVSGCASTAQSAAQAPGTSTSTDKPTPAVTFTLSPQKNSPVPTSTIEKRPAQPAATNTPTVAPLSNLPIRQAIFLAYADKDGEIMRLHAQDPANGYDIAGYPPLDLGQSITYAVSPDRQTLALIKIKLNNLDSTGELVFVDLTAWKITTTGLKIKGWARSIVFSPDGKLLAIQYGSLKLKLLIYDLAVNEVRSSIDMEQAITLMQFTSDGKNLLAYSHSEEYGNTVLKLEDVKPPQVMRLRTTDLSITWQVRLTQVRDGYIPNDSGLKIHTPGSGWMWQPGVAFSPAGDKVYIVHADEAKLTTVDFVHRKVTTVDILPKMTLLDRLMRLTATTAYAKVWDGTLLRAAISADGQQIYVVGVNNRLSQDKNSNWRLDITPTGLKVIRTQDGQEEFTYNTPASDISITSRGKYLLLTRWENEGNSAPSTQIVDLSEGKFQPVTKEGIFQGTYTLNGRFFLVSTSTSNSEQNRLFVWNPITLQESAQRIVKGYPTWIVVP